MEKLRCALKLGTKQVRVRLLGDRKLLEFEFFVTVPGLRSDWQRVDFESPYADDEWVNYDDPAELGMTGIYGEDKLPVANKRSSLTLEN